MKDMFEEKFWQVGERHGEKYWYDIFDSELFDEVCEEIAKELGLEYGDGEDAMFDALCENDEFYEWYREMAEDL